MTLRSIGGDSQVPLDHAAMLGLSEIVSALIDGGPQLRLPAAAAPDGSRHGIAAPEDDQPRLEKVRSRRSWSSCPTSGRCELCRFRADNPCKLWIQGRCAGVVWEIIDKRFRL